MVSEQGKPQEEKPAPSLTVRLAWWFGIYFAGQLPLIYYIGAICFFPVGLGLYLDYFLPAEPEKGPSSFVIFLPYAFYVVHLLFTTFVQSKNAFRILMTILIIIVVLNSVGCATMWNNVSSIH